MSFKMNLPPSMLAKMANNENDAGEGKERRTKEDWRKIKELEEDRKAGRVPAMQDEDGNDINPHIPQYIMQAPWYTGSTRPTLKHQKVLTKLGSSIDDWYQKGPKTGNVSTKYRKGACENCGAMGHVKKHCLERPRTIGAKFTNKCAPDDIEQPSLSFSYDGKRDRWNNYDADDYKKVVQEYQKIEEIKREMKAKKLDATLLNGEDTEKKREDDDDDDDDEDEDKYAEDVAMPGQKFESKQRITVRNLRMREDMPKYLYNLDLNSAHYDPKSRAMRANPFEGTGVEPKDLPYAGDNFVRYSGEAENAIKKQMFAWEAYSKGSDINVQADPTKLELLHREYEKKKANLKETVKSSILEKYGGKEHLDAPPMDFLLGQNENYVEYTRRGTLVKGFEKSKVKSRYEEDVMEKNHTAVWGSYWEAGRWGYKCCHSLVRNSYCIGEAGLKMKATDDPVSDERENCDEVDAKTFEVQPTTQPVKSIIDSNSLFHQHLERRQKEERIQAEQAEKNSKANKKKRHRKDSSDESSDSSSEEDREPKRKKHRDSTEKSRKKKRKHKKKHKKHRQSSSEDEDGDKKLKKAIEKERQRMKEVDVMMERGEKACPYNVTYDSKGPTDVEMEAYFRIRMRPEDPMANYLNGENCPA